MRHLHTSLLDFGRALRSAFFFGIMQYAKLKAGTDMRRSSSNTPITTKRAPRIPRWIWTSAGLLALALGTLGIVLPILPTTPFALLAAVCFAKGSPRLHQWLITHPWFATGIENWQKHGVIATRAKWMACSAMLAVFALSLVMGLPWKILTLQAFCLTGAATFILTRPGTPRTSEG